MKVKTVFISHLPIPNPNIGSWTNRYAKLMKENTASFDYIIAPQGYDFIDNLKYFLIKEPKFLTFKISKIIKYYKHKVYWKALRKVILKEGNLVINIIDNPNILFAINYYAKKNKLEHRLKIVFHMCGYKYHFDEKHTQIFYSSIDTLIVQTKSSLEFQKVFIKKGNCKVEQVYNGINSNKFYPIQITEKKKLRQKYNVSINKLVFLWVSQDRPKKGLSIILKSWEKLIKELDNIELLVIGAEKKGNYKNVNWLGRINNNLLPEYYQLSDFYLFPTQCNEGFGLTLGEALNCGITCLASNIDPMEELLNKGKYGRLVNNFSKPDSWVSAIYEEVEKYINNNFKNIYLNGVQGKLYNFEDWKDKIIHIINNG